MSTISLWGRVAKWTRQAGFWGVVLVCCALTPLRLDAQAFGIVEPPSASYSQAYDISGSNIVGSYYNSVTSRDSGYMYDGTNYTTIHIPGSERTGANGIDGSRIVGYYGSGNPENDRGYVFDGTSYQTLLYPGSDRSYANGISGNNIVGYYALGAGPGSSRRGFLYDGTNYSTIDYPGALHTLANSIDGNRIVGTYTPAGGASDLLGFVYDGSTYTSLSFPNSVSTIASGISGNNIVGSYRDTAGVQRGFVYDGTNWTTLQVPYSTTTTAYGIDGDNIVGTFNGPGTHGFQTTKPVPPREYVFKFTGTVTTVTDANGWFNNSFAVGQAIEGTYNVFDSGFELGQYLDPSTGGYFGASYRFHTAPNAAGFPVLPATVTIDDGANTYETLAVNGLSPYSVRIGNDSTGSISIFPVGDSYVLQSSLVMPDNFNNLAGDPVLDPNHRWSPAFGMSLRLTDSTGTALSSDELPLFALDVTKFTSAIARLSILDANNLTAAPFAQMVLRIDSISMVPEPGCAALLGIALASSLCVSRGRRQRVSLL